MPAKTANATLCVSFCCPHCKEVCVSEQIDGRQPCEYCGGTVIVNKPKPIVWLEMDSRKAAHGCTDIYCKICGG